MNVMSVGSKSQRAEMSDGSKSPRAEAADSSTSMRVVAVARVTSLRAAKDNLPARVPTMTVAAAQSTFIIPEQQRLGLGLLESLQNLRINVCI